MTEQQSPFFCDIDAQALTDVLSILPAEQPLLLQCQGKAATFSPATELEYQSRLVAFGDLNWFKLLELLKQTPIANGIAAIVVRCPCPTLPLALELRLQSKVNPEQKKGLMAWAELSGVELCYVESQIRLQQPGLIVMDMDSTAIEIECIDEIAKLAGVGEQVAAVTAQAMRGELDFAESLRARVATLKDAPVSVIDQVANNLPLMPGLTNLVKVLKQHNWKVVIASGGFTYMTEKLKQQLDLDKTVANQLGMEQGVLTGLVHGAIVDAQVKADTVVELAQEWDIPMSQTLAMGDGANDLVMMAAAELGVAFHAKPLVREKADVSIRTGALDQLLYLL